MWLVSHPLAVLGLGCLLHGPLMSLHITLLFFGLIGFSFELQTPLKLCIQTDKFLGVSLSYLSL